MNKENTQNGSNNHNDFGSNKIKKRMSVTQRETVMGYIFIIPWVIGFLIFTLYPMIMSMVMSFFNWDIFGEKIFIGLQNYIDLFAKEQFIIALKNTLLYALSTTVIGTVFGIIVAYVLLKASKLNLILRVIIYLPCLVIGVAFSMMMAPIFDASQAGLINQVLALFKLEPQAWLSVPGQAVGVLIFMSLWGLGGPMIIFTAAFKNVDVAVLEAAKIDGASRFQTLIKINIPIILPVIIYQTIMNVIGGLQVFDTAMGLAVASGTASNSMGANNALATLSYYLYRVGFTGADNNMGLAASVGWIIFFLTAIFSVIILIFIKKSKYYSLD